LILSEPLFLREAPFLAFSIQQRYHISVTAAGSFDTYSSHLRVLSSYFGGCYEAR